LYLLKDEQKTAFVQNLDAQASDAGWKHVKVDHGDGHRSYVCA
jgi:putative component of toxin-antitoxin plasmid stabilization module